MIPKKKSRPITVDETNYRYVISTAHTETSGEFHLNVTVQMAEVNGSILAVKGLITRDYWLDVPNEVHSKDHYPVLQPSHIAQFIQQAVKEGWQPKQKGPVFRLNVKNEDTFPG